MLTPDRFTALVASWSWIATLPDDERRDLLAAVRARVSDEARLALRYRTEVFTTTLAST